MLVVAERRDIASQPSEHLLENRSVLLERGRAGGEAFPVTGRALGGCRKIHVDLQLITPKHSAFQLMPIVGKLPVAKRAAGLRPLESIGFVIIVEELPSVIATSDEPELVVGVAF